MGFHFEEAKTVFDDPNVLIKPDIPHSDIEDRAYVIGMSCFARVLFVVAVERYENTIRIISARKPTRREAENYAEAKR
jgi:uncharacterized DUF497 family protein